MKVKMPSLSKETSDSLFPFELEATEPASENMDSVTPVASSEPSVLLRPYSIVSLHVSFGDDMELSLCETEMMSMDNLVSMISCNFSIPQSQLQIITNKPECNKRFYLSSGLVKLQNLHN